MSDEKEGLTPAEETLYQRVCDLLSHDAAVARCVLGKDKGILNDKKRFKECLKDPFRPINWMGGLFTLAAQFLYAKFNAWRMEKGSNPNSKEMPNILYLNRMLTGILDVKEYFDKTSSAVRTLRVLDGLYDMFDMDFLVVKYIITNSQMDAGFNFNSQKIKRKGLSKLMGFPDEESFVQTCDINNDYEVTGKNLAEAFNYVLVCRSDPGLAAAAGSMKHDPVRVGAALGDVVDALDFIRRIRIKAEKNGDAVFAESTKGGVREVPSYGSVRIFRKSGDKFKAFEPKENFADDPSVEFFHLEHVDHLIDNASASAALGLKYQSFDDSTSLSVFAAERKEFAPAEDYELSVILDRSATDLFRLISGYLPGARAKTSFFRGMISAHYRYHSILAPAVVDAIDYDRDAKSRLLDTFARRNEPAFRQMLEPSFETWEFMYGKVLPETWEGKIDELCDFVKKSENKFRRLIDWDTFVGRILVYSGPTELIRTALLHDKESDQGGKSHYDERDKDRIDETCRQIIAGLEMRYIDAIFDAYTVWKRKDKVYEVFGARIEHLKSLFPGDPYIIKLECKALAQSYIDAIVKTLTKIDEDDSKTDKFRFNKFAENSIQDSLNILLNCCNKTDKFSKNAQQAFLRTAMAFLSFYEGVYECCRQRMSYEFEKTASILRPEEIEEYRWKLEESFIAGARREAVRLAKEFSGDNPVRNALAELWKFSDKTVKRTEERAKYYFAMFGRPPVSHTGLAKIYEIHDGAIFFKDNGKNYDYSNIRENDPRNMMFLWKVVNFLAGGESGGDEDEYVDRSSHAAYKEHAKRVVYPQVVTFARHHMDGDSNDSLIMMDLGNAFSDWHEEEVRILTEFKYKIDRAYYALPNLNRIEKEWWVDPFLIPCYKFDKEIRDATGSMELKK